MANLPLIPQTLDQYLSISENMWPGMPAVEDIRTKRKGQAIVANSPFTKEQWSVEVVFGVDGDPWGININGAFYLSVFQTDAEISAQNWITTNGQNLVNSKILASLPISDGLGVLSLAFVDGLNPSLTPYAPDSGAVNLVEDVPGTGPDLYITWGMGVIKDPDRKAPNFPLVVRRAKTALEVTNYFKQGGVVCWAPHDTDDARVAAGWPSAVDIPPDMPFHVYQIYSGEHPYIHYAIDGDPPLADEGDEAFLVFDENNADWGKFRGDSGGTSQVDTLTFDNSTVAATVAGSYDGLPDISFVDTGTDVGNAAAFAAAANGNVQYSALATFVAVGVDVTVTFKNFVSHLFTDNSTGGPTITAVVTQLSIPAIAEATGLKFLKAPVAARPGIMMAALNMSS